MKYKIVGWTSYEDNGFKEMPFMSHHAYLCLIKEIRDKGYHISGYDHQENDWVPIFNTRQVVRYSQRGWGALMADAEQIGQKDGYEYSIYGVGGAVMGYNKESLSSYDDLDLPKLSEICDYYKIKITQNYYNDYVNGINHFRLVINNELSDVDSLDRIILQYKDNQIITEVLDFFTFSIDDENEIIEYMKKFEKNNKRERIITIYDPFTSFNENENKKGLVLKVLKNKK